MSYLIILLNIISDGLSEDVFELRKRKILSHINNINRMYYCGMHNFFLFLFFLFRLGPFIIALSKCNRLSNSKGNISNILS